MKITDTLRNLRIKRGLTQVELSRQAGLAERSVCQIERAGGARPSSILALANALNVPVRDLVAETVEDADLAIPVYLDKGAYLPRRAHSADAGYDLRSPKMDLVPKHGSTVIDTGVHVAIPKGLCGVLVSKSGLNVKHDIVSEGLIDSGYTGSIKVKLYNHGGTSYMIEPGDKISQLVFLPIAEPVLYQTKDPLEETERGDKGFGSTGK